MSANAIISITSLVVFIFIVIALTGVGVFYGGTGMYFLIPVMAGSVWLLSAASAFRAHGIARGGLGVLWLSIGGGLLTLFFSGVCVLSLNSRQYPTAAHAAAISLSWLHAKWWCRQYCSNWRSNESLDHEADTAATLVRCEMENRGIAAYRILIHIIAALCGLFITAFIWLVVYKVWQHEGFTFRTIGCAIIAPAAGFESWRQTIKLNRRNRYHPVN